MGLPTTEEAAMPKPAIDQEALIEMFSTATAKQGKLLQAVEANRVALQQFVDQGVGLQEKQLKKAVDDLEKFEGLLIDAVKKATEGAGAQLASQWAPVLDKLQAGGTQSGSQAAAAAEQ